MADLPRDTFRTAADLRHGAYMAMKALEGTQKEDLGIALYYSVCGFFPSGAEVTAQEVRFLLGQADQ